MKINSKLLILFQVQARAREIYRARGYTDMKCSYGWFKRWSQRFHIQLRYSYDDELLEWILAKFDANTNVNHHDLQTHGLNLVRKEDPHFKASSGWALRYELYFEPLTFASTCLIFLCLVRPNLDENSLGHKSHL